MDLICRPGRSGVCIARLCVQELVASLWWVTVNVHYICTAANQRIWGEILSICGWFTKSYMFPLCRVKTRWAPVKKTKLAFVCLPHFIERTPLFGPGNTVTTVYCVCFMQWNCPRGMFSKCNAPGCQWNLLTSQVIFPCKGNMPWFQSTMMISAHLFCVWGQVSIAANSFVLYVVFDLKIFSVKPVLLPAHKGAASIHTVGSTIHTRLVVV